MPVNLSETREPPREMCIRDRIVPANELERGIFRRRLEELLHAGGEIVPPDDADPVRQEAVDQA